MREAVSRTNSNAEVDWPSNPEVLKRLTKVWELYLVGHTLIEIAEELGRKPSAIEADINRCLQIIQCRTFSTIEEKAAESVSRLRMYQSIAMRQFERIQKAREERNKLFEKSGDDLDIMDLLKLNEQIGQEDGTAWLNVALNCEQKIIKIQGTYAPQQINIQATLSKSELEDQIKQKILVLGNDDFLINNTEPRKLLSVDNAKKTNS